MSKRNLGKWMAIGLGLTAAVAMPLGASAHGWGHGWGHGGYHHGYYRGGGYYHHRGYWSGGRWIAGAIVTGAVAGLVSDALSPPVVYAPPPRVVYEQPTTVVYESAPVTRRVVTTRTVVYDDGPTRYVRDDGYDGD
ncbi:hypothetical protein QMK61_14070 [Fulvimonas sp. R45]|uniref:hypothetical protein n=1 Tax=Fulvimonas sp. R45 TaxID=3045937 RepID=UPI0026600926|nr:hypothetical protein [Fulvimonas sp. R45]MDO1529962.1 hypothetical protein [Fulvimonas sp. R45]